MGWSRSVDRDDEVSCATREQCVVARIGDRHQVIGREAVCVHLTATDTTKEVLLELRDRNRTIEHLEQIG